jgi:uncharacterized protein (TIGR02117 family)
MTGAGTALRAGRVLLGLLLALLAIPLAYFALLLLLGLFPANAGWREAEEGVVVFVNTNGVHTGIGMPLHNEIMDWRPYVPAAHLRRPRHGNYIIVGYGNRDFYLNTPSWAELSLSTATKAAFGVGSTLLHVDHVQDPREGSEQRALTLSAEEYRRLVAFVRPRFRLDGQGRTIPVLGRGYQDNDMFYQAHGGYSAWLTCNEWTGRALRAAGVRMGVWTPVEQSVMWRLP